MAAGDLENGDPVDRAGRSILRLLEKAADTAEQGDRQAFEMAQTLSQQLRIAQS
jgi:hypothetical protein